MPELDVSFMVDDPMFQDGFNIIRRYGGVSARGRSKVLELATIPATGTVTQDEPDQLVRTPDGQHAPRKIKVFTATPVYGPASDLIVSAGAQVVEPEPDVGLPYQPDVIEWNGSQYLVTEVLPYSRYGSGFYEVSAASQTMQETTQ